MMRLSSRSMSCMLACQLMLTAAASGQGPSPQPQPMLRDMKNPESVAIGPDGKPYVSLIGEFDQDGDGSIVVFDAGKPKTFAAGLDDPKGLAVLDGSFVVADKKRVLRIDRQGRSSVLAAKEAFPREPKFLNDVVVDDAGNVYVSDSGDLKGNDGAVFRIAPDGRVTLVTDAQKAPSLKGPNGLLVDDAGHLLLLDFVSGELSRLTLADGSLAKLADGFPGGDGLARDWDGNLYISQWTTGALSVLPAGSTQARALPVTFTAAADICLNYKTGQIMTPDMKAGTLTPVALPDANPTDVDTSPLPVQVTPAFAALSFERPIVLTHAGDGTNRVFVCSQLGRVHVFANDPGVAQSSLFLDIKPKVQYKDRENEEGLLGFAFHPKYKENGQFFIYYTTTDAPHTSVVSRFKVSADDPNRADPASEQEVLRIPQPYWNHNGGTIAFGPDGYLYVALGDGGSANDPQGNGQNLTTLLGSILRIDIDRKDAGLAYAVPADNPFVGRSDARPEIWAYGVRNPWRIAFDNQTGACWCADVGQDIWEEIDLIVKGGNYGWNRREARHKFRANGSGPDAAYIEPIWEYHHDIGKSITGGHVYRGRRLPELAGHYLYADYVTGRVWGLRYDEARRQVVANRSIPGNLNPVMSFGEDEQGEVYFMTTQGQLYSFAKAE